MTAGTEKYLLDSNVFIEAYRRYYSFDICPGFWDCLVHHSNESVLLSIDKVKDELMTGDHLSGWIRNSLSKNMFQSTSEAGVVNQFTSIMRHVQSLKQYTSEAKSEFAQVADGWLIAYAKQYNCIVVTHEVLNQNKRSKVPIPNLCKDFSVSYLNTFDMLKNLNARFNWR